MPDTTTTPPDEQEVQKTVTVQGKVRFGLDQINNPTPDKWKRISQGLKYLFTGLIAMVASTTIFTSKQSNIINFCLAIAILILGAIDVMMGVSPTIDNKKGIV